MRRIVKKLVACAVGWQAGVLILASACATAPVAQRPGRDQDIAMVVRLVDEARASRALPPSMPLHRLAPDMERLAASFERGGEDPHQALQDLLQKGLASLNGGTAFAWIGMAGQLEDLEIPDMLADAQTLRLAVGVARCRSAELPEGGYCALVAAVEIRGPGR